jgi:hypothetical protein
MKAHTCGSWRASFITLRSRSPISRSLAFCLDERFDRGGQLGPVGNERLGTYRKDVECRPTDDEAKVL